VFLKHALAGERQRLWHAVMKRKNPFADGTRARAGFERAREDVLALLTD